MKILESVTNTLKTSRLMKQAMALFEHETKLVDEIPESAEVVLRQAGAWRTEKLDGLWQAGKNQITQLIVFHTLE
jgi:hypothetical protein